MVLSLCQAYDLYVEEEERLVALLVHAADMERRFSAEDAPRAALYGEALHLLRLRLAAVEARTGEAC